MASPGTPIRTHIIGAANSGAPADRRIAIPFSGDAASFYEGNYLISHIIQVYTECQELVILAGDDTVDAAAPPAHLSANPPTYDVPTGAGAYFEINWRAIDANATHISVSGNIDAKTKISFLSMGPNAIS